LRALGLKRSAGQRGLARLHQRPQRTEVPRCSDAPRMLATPDVRQIPRRLDLGCGPPEQSTDPCPCESRCPQIEVEVRSCSAQTHSNFAGLKCWPKGALGQVAIERVLYFPSIGPLLGSWLRVTRRRVCDREHHPVSHLTEALDHRGVDLRPGQQSRGLQRCYSRTCDRHEP
jgi:hypothetical protein